MKKTRAKEEYIRLDPRISFQEIDRYILSGYACAYFQVATFADVLKSTFTPTFAKIREKGISFPTLYYFLLTIKFLKSKPIVPLLWKSLQQQPSQSFYIPHRQFSLTLCRTVFLISGNLLL